MKKKLTLLPMIAILSFLFLNVTIGLHFYHKNNSQNELVRLHVVANSNSLDDQMIKLKINEKVEDYIDSLDHSTNSSTNETLEQLINHSNQILKIVNDTLVQEQYPYRATLEIGKIRYDQKDSMLVHMEEGIYPSAKLILGKGEGKNIWSFIFPDEKAISKLQAYDTILPGISKIYSDEPKQNKTYKSKLYEILNQL